MDDELCYLRMENARLRKYEDMYNELLMQGIQHGQKMMGGLLEIAMTPGVLPAIAKHNEAQQENNHD